MEDFLDESYFDKKNQQSEIAYEEKMVKQLLTYLCCEDDFKELKSKNKEEGREGVTFLQLREHNSYLLPVAIVTRKIPYVHQITVERLFKSFTKTPLYSEFCEVDHELQHLECNVGMVFNWPTLGACILHNSPGGERDAYFSRTIGGVTYILEPWSSFMQSLS